MRTINLFTVGAAAVLLSACSSIIEGTSQNIAVSTDPAGADCALVRQGNVIGRVNPTPGTVKIDKTKHDITVECALEGYQPASFFNKSDVAGATVGNVIAGGLVGWAIDSATGADNKYTGSVHIEMVPTGNSAPAAAPVETPPAPTATSATPTS